MQAVTGTFKSRAEAEQAVEQLTRELQPQDIYLLTPSTPEEAVHAVPTTKDMPPVGKYIGGALGGAVGLGLGAALLLPGVGTVTALGAGAIALFGSAGALAGGAAGSAVDQVAHEGLPVDELYIYEDALRKGRSVIFVMAKNENEKIKARKLLSAAGAEGVDAARDNWWVGLRSSEELEYKTTGRDFRKDEPIYRRGFEAALAFKTRGRPYEEVVDYLKSRYPDVYDHEVFRYGYRRGHSYGLTAGRLHEQPAPGQRPEQGNGQGVGV